MEYTREQILRLKEDIRTKAAEQKSIKPQRKTTHFTGTRTMEPWLAVARHHINRYDLRHMYIAYGFMRGKTIAQIEKEGAIYDAKKVNHLLEVYAAEVVHSNA